MKFSTLWVGPPTTIIQDLALASYAHYGHELTVYTDTLDRKLPTGVVKRLASEVLSNDNQFYVMNDFVTYSDHFRYKLLSTYDTVWVDADSVCLRESMPMFDAPYVFPKEDEFDKYAQGVLKAPTDSPLLQQLLEKASKPVLDKVDFGYLGPNLFTELVQTLELEGYSVPGSALLMINPTEAIKLWRHFNFEEMLERLDEAYMLSVYNTMAKAYVPELVARDLFPRGSFLEYLHKKVTT